MFKQVAACALAAASVGILTSCRGSRAQNIASEGAPPQTEVIEQPDLSIVKVNNPDRFRLVSAGAIRERPELHAVGAVNADVEKSVPVISLASGRVVEVDAKLGDDVRKGQLLLKILSNDIANGFQTYRQAVADEVLSRKQLERAQLLYEHGAISLNDLQVAEDTDSKAKVAVETATEQLHTLGADVNHPSSVVNIYAPASGTIVEQNVVAAADVHSPDNQPNLFTIANLSTVWVIADVYEDDIPMLRLGDIADVELDAYPGRVFHGRIDNIGKILDPNIRTAKVRVVLANPGMMRAGMFVRTTFYGQQGREYALIPSGAVLHLHDRNWVFVPAPHNEFRRTEVSVGKIEDQHQEILSGIQAGQQVVADALAFSAESSQ